MPVEAPPPSSTPNATTSVPVVQRQPAAPSQARIDLEFAGFIEKTQPGGKNEKYAVFLDGVEILTGAEGDLVGNRYKIVQIGLESATVSVEGSGATKKIPLRTN
jgi:hypothetical protein